MNVQMYDYQLRIQPSIEHHAFEQRQIVVVLLTEISWLYQWTTIAGSGNLFRISTNSLYAARQ